MAGRLHLVTCWLLTGQDVLVSLMWFPAEDTCGAHVTVRSGREEQQRCADALGCRPFWHSCKHVLYLAFTFPLKSGKGTWKFIPPLPSVSRWGRARCWGTESGSWCPDSLGPGLTGKPLAALRLQRRMPLAPMEIT